jgi:uncharacterized protein
VKNFTKQNNRVPAYKEPWFWMVFGPLIFVVITGIGVTILAFKVADDRVDSDYYKEGRTINSNFAAQKMGIELGIKGELNFAFDTLDVTLNIKTEVVPKSLFLKFSHPLHSQEDFEIEFERTGSTSFRADLANKLSGPWYLILRGAADDFAPPWQVSTQIDFDKVRTTTFAAHL